MSSTKATQELPFRKRRRSVDRLRDELRHDAQNTELGQVSTSSDANASSKNDLQSNSDPPASAETSSASKVTNPSAASSAQQAMPSSGAAKSENASPHRPRRKSAQGQHMHSGKSSQHPLHDEVQPSLTVPRRPAHESLVQEGYEFNTTGANPNESQSLTPADDGVTHNTVRKPGNDVMAATGVGITTAAAVASETGTKAQLPASIIGLNSVSSREGKTAEKHEDAKKEKTCCEKFIDCYKQSPFCPSKTRAMELVCILCNALAIALYVLAMTVAWVVSTSPCTDCPPGFAAGYFLQQNQMSVGYGIFVAGQLFSSAYVNVSLYFLSWNSTLGNQFADQYQGYYFPPGSVMQWNQLGDNGVCTPNSASSVAWGIPYGLCPYSTPSPVMGVQAFCVLACVFACLSFLSMIAARKGRLGFAQFSAVCSTCSFGFGIGAVVWFSQWGYNEQHLSAGKSTVPIQVLQRDGTVSEFGVVPLDANFAKGSGYICCIFAIVFETISTIIAWIAGTERCWWSPDVDVVYGPEAWMYSVDGDIRDRVHRPTLAEMMDDEERGYHPARDEYDMGRDLNGTVKQVVLV